MTIQTINIGNSANDGNGEPARSAFNKINQNFTNYSHSASRLVGTQSGNVMEVGAFGLGVGNPPDRGDASNQKLLGTGFYNGSGLGEGRYDYGQIQVINSYRWVHRIFYPAYAGAPEISTSTNGGDWSNWGQYLILGRNATRDSNGFIKAASPIVKIFSEKIELNDEAAEQNITFKKVDIGHYLIQGSSGFALEGWYIETPKDANGNILFAVNYEQLENGDIEVKTYKKKFDLESASIVADLENPVDITLNRWIDIRLQEVPKPAPDMQTEEVNLDEPQQ